MLKFSKFVNVSNWKIPNIWSFSKLVNRRNLGNYLIFQILNSWGWDLEFQKSKMRIGEITNSAAYQMDEQNQNLPIFGNKLWFSKFKKKFANLRISKIIKFPLLTNSKKNNQSSNFLNLTIFKTQNSKNFDFDGNYQICILSVRII